MDSLTQIVLGAAVGEVCLGKKIGNRAMLWGGVGGTIPDLDIIGNLFLGEAEALAFHRGISHSVTFAIFGALVIGWLIDKLYNTKGRHWTETILSIGFYCFGLLFVSGILLAIGPEMKLITIPLMIAVASFGIWRIRKDLFIRKDSFERPSVRSWQNMMFWALLTHPILDSFTSYGTQLFAPFSNYRVAFNNISVADPMYTALFLIGLIAASFYSRKTSTRRYMNYLGIALSSAYMLFTGYNKLRVDKVMESTLQTENIVSKKYMTSPTILNNVLWTGTAETDSFFYQGQYSLLDKDKSFKLSKVPKKHHLLADAKSDDKTINILKWFSKEYFTLLERSDGYLQFNDMRYGTFRGDSYGENDFIFRFILEKDENGYYQMLDAAGGPPEDMDQGAMATELWTRIKGI